MTFRRRALLVLPLTLIAASCAPGAIGYDDDDADFHGEEAEGGGLVPRSAGGSVESAITTSCSTSSVMGLSRQIAREVGCSYPDSLVSFAGGGGIEFVGAAVLPYLDGKAVAGLRAAAARGVAIKITSAYRSVAQQYVIRRWYEAGRCGISAAARPGRSNHESGRALDISNHGSVASALRLEGWRQTVSGDVVHFEYLQAPDRRGTDVMAFQRLWNRNHPDDLIEEDGDYGPHTAARLAQAPAAGFPIDACASRPAAGPVGGAAGGADAPGAAGAADAPDAPVDECGGLGFQGECHGDLLRWCEGGQARTFDCAPEGLACRWRDGEVGFDCLPAAAPPTPADPCAGLGYQGACQGDVVRWCEGGVLHTTDCGASGMTCGWWSDDVGFNCVASAPAPADPCGGLTYQGECQGDVIRWCEDGTPKTADCAASGLTCGWRADQSLNDCL